MKLPKIINPESREFATCTFHSQTYQNNYQSYQIPLFQRELLQRELPSPLQREFPSPLQRELLNLHMMSNLQSILQSLLHLHQDALQELNGFLTGLQCLGNLAGHSQTRRAKLTLSAIVLINSREPLENLETADILQIFNGNLFSTYALPILEPLVLL